MKYKLIQTTSGVCMAISCAHNTKSRQIITSPDETPSDIQHFIEGSKHPIFIIRPSRRVRVFDAYHQGGLPASIEDTLTYEYFLCVTED